MKTQGIVTASENWRDTGKLPLPVQFLIEASRLMPDNPNGIRFRLISNWAINKENMPRTDFEETGLLEIAVSPERPYKGTKTEHGIEYFEALYPDIAVSQSCVRCHNTHPQSPKKDFRGRRRDGRPVVEHSGQPIAKYGLRKRCQEPFRQRVAGRLVPRLPLSHRSSHLTSR